MTINCDYSPCLRLVYIWTYGPRFYVQWLDNLHNGQCGRHQDLHEFIDVCEIRTLSINLIVPNDFLNDPTSIT